VQSLYPTAPSALSSEDLAALYAYPTEHRWLRANFVSSLDGAAQGSDQKSGTLSGRTDQQVFALLRSLCDLILVGAGTTRVEGYQPVQTEELRADLRTRLGLAPLPTIAVVSRSLELDPALLADGTAATIVVTTESSPPDLRRRIAASNPVIVAGEVDVDLRHAVDELGALGFHRMLCEGGPSLLRDLLAAEVIDELCLTVEPVLVAGSRLRITDGGGLEPAQGMVLRHLLEADSVLFARYTRPTR